MKTIIIEQIKMKSIIKKIFLLLPLVLAWAACNDYPIDEDGLLIDTSPSALVLPTSIFDMIEEANDYYGFSTAHRNLPENFP